MKLVARDYQVEAIEAICNGLNEQDRVTAVMACGTGKTLVSLWVAEKMGVQRIVVFMPSLMLIKQTIDTWTEQTEWPWYSYMAVCCDDKLLDDDLIDIDAKECCFDVCIDAEQVRTFIGRTEIEAANRSVHIVFCTYQSSHIIPKDIQFDLGIFDEAHKTAHKDMGSFRHALYEENVTIKKRLFLTATPRHYQLKGKTTHLEYSMSNEKVYGPIVYRLDFAQAIRRGIICDYKVLITIMNEDIVLEECANKIINKDGNSFNMQMMSHVIALKQAFEKYPINRAVTFLRTIKDTKEFSRTARHLKDMKCNILDINSHMNSDERRTTMRAFEYSSKAIISNARCLSEGVDIPSIDLIAFLSPKKSKIDIIQAVGRVMRNAPGKEYGYILLPVFAKSSLIIEQVLESSEYHYIMEIINSLREYDTDLQQQISDQFTGSRGEHQERSKSKIEFVNADITSNELAQAIDINILERFKDDWDVRLEEIKQWYQKNGSWEIPGRNNVYNPIRGWINWQRTEYKAGQLSDERVEKLRSINFVFDMTECRYEKKFEIFKEITERHGLKKTIRQYDASVDNWFQFMKMKIKKGEKLPIINRLLDYVKTYPNYENCLEISDAKNAEKVQRNLKFLQDYYKKNGHIKVRYNENSNVKKWLVSLHKGKWRNLKDKTKQSLIAVGFVYEKDVQRRSCIDEWNKNYQLLQEHKKINPELIMTKKDPELQQLRRWVVRQRDRYRNGSNFLPGQKEKLETIGLFNVGKNKRWKKNYQPAER